MPKIIAGLDLGTNNIRGAVVKIDGKNRIELIGVDTIPSNGIECGTVVNLELASREVNNLLTRLERKTGRRIKRVSAVVSDPMVEGIEANGMIALGKRPRQVSSRDIEKCLKAASMVNIPEDRYVVLKNITGYYVNEWEKVLNPMDLFATKLGIKAYIVSIRISRLENLRKCIEHTGCILENCVFSPRAVLEAAYVPDETDLRPMIMDIGCSSTSLTAFNGTSVVFASNIDAGGEFLSQTDKLGQYIFRLKDTLAGHDLSSIIVTGGGALTDNLLEHLESSLNIRCRLGTTRVKWAELSPSDSISHACTIGLMEYECKRMLAEKNKGNVFSRGIRFLNNVMESYF